MEKTVDASQRKKIAFFAEMPYLRGFAQHYFYISSYFFEKSVQMCRDTVRVDNLCFLIYKTGFRKKMLKYSKY